MNIFVLDADPVRAAQWQCDRHVIKMTLETAQLLCSVHHFFGYKAPYKKTHINHPCAVWARESLANYEWLLAHGKALGEEYTARYGKIHKSVSAMPDPIKELPDIELTPFVLAMPSQYWSDSAVKSYRAYYKGAKNKFATWIRNKPDWWNLPITT